MRQYFKIIAVAAAAVITASCIGELTGQESDIRVFEASFAGNGPDTRTSINQSNQTLWVLNDEISVWDGYQVQGRATRVTENGKTAHFTMDSPVSASASMASYPWGMSASDGAGLQLFVSDSPDGSFANANLCFGKPVNGTIKFHNATAVFKIEVSDPSVKSVGISSESTALSGYVVSPEFSSDGSLLTNIDVIRKNSKKITLDTPSTGTYYIPMLPGSFAAEDLTFEFKDSAGAAVWSYSYPKAITVEIGQMVDWGDFLNVSQTLEHGLLTIEDAAAMPQDEIWYTTTDGKPIEIADASGLVDAEIVSNTYQGFHGVLKLSKVPSKVKEGASSKFASYEECLRITSILMPSSIRLVEYEGLGGFNEMKSIIFQEGLEEMQYAALCGCSSLETVYLPSSLKKMEYSVFYDDPIRQFLGPCDLIIMDGQAVTYFNNYVDQLEGIDYSGLWIAKVSTDVVNLDIPDGLVTAIGAGALKHCRNLKSIFIPSSVKFVGADNFYFVDNLEYIGGPYASADHRCYIFNGELQAFARAGLKSYSTPSNVTSLSREVFEACASLEELVINDEVTEIGAYAFSNCVNLKKLTLPASLRSFSHDPFICCERLQDIYVRALIPPSLTDVTYTTEFPDLTIHVPEESISLYRSHSYWGTTYGKYLEPMHFEDISHPDIYMSTDFSSSGKVKQIQKATAGNGIDLVFMGDGFSDRQIADGTYDSWMTKAMESVFEVEPYRTFRNLFNVYAVYVVSNTEGFDHGDGALSTEFGYMTYVTGDMDLIKNYAFKAVDRSREDDLSVLVIPNHDRYAGTCTFMDPISPDGNVKGLCIAWVPAQSNIEAFSTTIHHEFCGHAFGKLCDEYFYAGETADKGFIDQYTYERSAYGWWPNIDFTTSPSKVYWSKFLSDSRYDGQGLGIFEGAYVQYGAYRPTEDSIMRYNVGGFNAPSRENIYKRIMRLAYGSSWSYDYEEFVIYDQVNRPSSSAHTGPLRGVGAPFKTEKDFIPLARPVIMHGDDVMAQQRRSGGE